MLTRFLPSGKAERGILSLSIPIENRPSRGSARGYEGTSTMTGTSGAATFSEVQTQMCFPTAPRGLLESGQQ